MTSVMTAQLPKYVEEANAVLRVLADTPNRIWTRTQRELAQELGLAQPVVSLRVKLLMEQGRIRKGEPLPMRGRNHALVVLDDTPLDETVRLQASPAVRYEHDRVMTEQEERGAAYALHDVTPEKVGLAIIEALHDMWEREERARLIETQQGQIVRQLRDVIADHQRATQELTRDKRDLEERLATLEREKNQLRSTVNQLIVTVNSAKDRRNTVRATELMDDESREILQRLLTETPGSHSAEG